MSSIEERLRNVEEICRIYFGTTNPERFKKMLSLQAELLKADEQETRHILKEMEELKRLG